MRFTPAQIRRYDDRNTSTFVALGQGGGVGAIHRAVWGPGVTVREAAFHFVEDRIAELGNLIGLTGASSPECNAAVLISWRHREDCL